MVNAWYLTNDAVQDAAKPADAESVSLTHLSTLGVLYWNVESNQYQQNATFNAICENRKYVHSDLVSWTPETSRVKANLLEKLLEEHLHDYEEGRYVIDGSVFIDVRDLNSGRWIRIEAVKNALFVLPAGIFHRIALNTKLTATMLYLYQTSPTWESFSSVDYAANRDVHKRYIEQMSAMNMPNGTGIVVSDRATAYANYPHARAINGFIHVSGTSSRRSDNSHVGATQNEDGSWKLDIREQTRAVLENIKWILQQRGADLRHLVAVTVYLVDFKDYPGFNEIYNQYFDANTGPTRTTVAVARLPHPNLLIEIQSIAADPKSPTTA